MSFIIKLFLYLFISTSVLVFSYDVVKYARDSMRISNMNTLYRVILYYQGMEEATPPSGKNIIHQHFSLIKGTWKMNSETLRLLAQQF